MKEGWEHKKLGEVCNIYQPKTISQKDMIPNGQYKVFGANGVIGRYHSFNHEHAEVLVTCRGATCGTINVSEPHAWVTGNAMVVSPLQDNLSKAFLKFVLETLDFSDVITGAAQPQITRTSLSPVEIPLPPLEEQKRIVAVLDEAFAGLETARANAEANLKNIEELYSSSFEDLYKDQSYDWSTQKLSDVYDIRDGTHDSPTYKESGFPLVTSKNLKNMKLDLTSCKMISEEDYNEINRRSRVDVGDVLMAMIGTIGNAVTVEDEPNYAIKNVALFKTPSDRSGKVLASILNSKRVSVRMIKEARGTTQRFVGLNYLRDLEVELPASISEIRLEGLIKQLRNSANFARDEYELKRSSLLDLRQSLLQKAFAGELT